MMTGLVVENLKNESINLQQLAVYDQKLKYEGALLVPDKSESFENPRPRDTSIIRFDFSSGSKDLYGASWFDEVFNNNVQQQQYCSDFKDQHVFDQVHIFGFRIWCSLKPQHCCCSGKSFQSYNISKYTPPHCSKMYTPFPAQQQSVCLPTTSASQIDPRSK